MSLLSGDADISSLIQLLPQLIEQVIILCDAS